MKKIMALLTALAVSLMGVLVGVQSASATVAEKCYEIITETVVVEEAVPAVPEVPEEFEIIEHPAVTETIEHPAVTKTEYQWKWWGNRLHGTTAWTDGSTPDRLRGGGAGEWLKNGNTREVVLKEAYTETVVVKEAYTEKVITQPYVPAVPGKDAVTEEVEREVEVECPIVEPEPEPEPPVEEPPVVTPPVDEPDIDVPLTVVEVPVKVDAPKAAAPTVAPAAGVLPNAGGPALLPLAFGLTLLFGGMALLRRMRS